MSTQPKNTKFQHRATSVFTIASLITIGFLPFTSSAVADSAPAAGTVITNFSTATFEDPLQLTTAGTTSNIVTVTIAEIAGVSVVGTGIDANPNINPGDIIYFNFTINNVGNDPTQFFIPSLPSSVSALGTFTAATAPIEIVETKDGNGVVVPLPGGVAKISVPVTGGTTSPSVPAGGTVRIRVPIKVAAGVVTGNTITVVMGNTLAATRSNQDYVSGGATSTATTDLYTVDNTVTPLPAGEISGTPVNGDTTNHRREASASQDVTINPAVIPNDFGELPSTYKTTLADNGARHTIVPSVYLGTSVTAEANGSPVISPAAIVAADNDGVIFDPIYGQQILKASTAGNTTNTIKVTASTAGYLNAWIDLNGNGIFDAVDRVLTEVPVVAGANNINITLPNSVTNGKTYARFRFTTGLNQATLPTGLAPNGEVEDYQIEIVKTSPAPTITSLCADRNGTTTTSNLIPGGKFPLVGNLATNIPGATTDYIYDSDPVWSNGWPNNGSTTPNDGHYLVAPSTGLTTYSNGAWHDLSEHTGDGGGMMVVNGNSSTKVFETTIAGLTVGKTYEFSTWAANLATATGGSSLPDLKLEYSEDGGTTWNPLTDSGAIAQTATPTWNIYGNFFTPKTTSVKLRISNNNTTGTAGNDLAIDDLRLEGCDVPLVSGRVFEDVNYGGGAGRNYVTAKNSSQTVQIEVPNAVVELYEKQPDNSFKKVAQRNTIGDGSYEFTTADGVSYNGTYRLRVVNTSVKSNRPGSVATLIPVQTFRKDPSATTPDIVDEIGGVSPQLVDATVQTNGTLFTALTTATTAAQSSTAATMNNTEVKNLDFGYNFDTIVNTNDLGQGSLRQFILNSNALGNTGLDQVINPAPAATTTAIDSAPGIETSIFMIPSTSLTSGAANIALATILTVTADDTVIDGRTQTANIGDTNTGTLGGSGQAVGISAQLLPSYQKPEVSLSMSTGAASNSIEIQGNGDAVIGLGFSTNITSGITVSGGSVTKPTLIQSNIMGLKPDGTAGSVWQSITANQAVNPSKYLNILDNLVSNNSFAGVSSSSQGLIQGNHFFRNGTGSCDDNLSVEKSSINTITINKNLFEEAAANAIEGYSIPGGVTITENTIRTSGRNGTLCDGSIENDGIRMFGSSSKIQKNIINNNGGAGVVLTGSGGTKNLISQNSFFQNGKLGIDLDAFLVASINPTGDGVTPNDGVKNTTPNNGMDYPIITSSVLSGGNLTVKGYVGNVATGSATFATATLEFFIADDDLNNNGPVILSDGKSKPHGEGKTYIGGSTAGNLCVTTANSSFTCTFPAPVGLTNAQNITATATDSLGSTSEFSAVPGKAQLLLVKRITAIKDGITGLPLKNAAGVPISFSAFVDDTTSTSKTDDNSCNWPTATPAAGTCSNTYTIGATTETAPKVKSGDEIEYTIYYLNAGENKATARVCDRLNPNLTFQPNFDASNVAKGIGFKPGTTGITYLTNLGTDTDKGQLTNASVTNCNLPSNAGTQVVAVDVGDATTPLLGSTGAGLPTSSYGYIRFKATVK
jgi:uncharacterized repeat protein (TIGR01451 family)